MTIHENVTVTRHDNGENAWPTYVVEWADGEPEPGDKVLISAELFQRSIEILSGVCHSCALRMDELANPRTPPAGSCTSCPNRDPRVSRSVPLLDVDERLH